MLSARLLHTAERTSSFDSTSSDDASAWTDDYSSWNDSSYSCTWGDADYTDDWSVFAMADSSSSGSGWTAE